MRHRHTHTHADTHTCKVAIMIKDAAAFVRKLTPWTEWLARKEPLRDIRELLLAEETSRRSAGESASGPRDG